MCLIQEQLLNPIRKLRKLVEELPKITLLDQVHALRTQTRRIKATLHAFKFDQTKKGRRLLGVVTPLRKAAGKVRDMDVLTGLALTIANDGLTKRCVQLVEHLDARRFRFAERLSDEISGRREQDSRRLKRFDASINRRLASATESGIQPWQTDPVAVAEVSSELASWPKVNRNNLHADRLKVKELRYHLELGSDPDPMLLDALQEVKDSIGEWHDWDELEGIARKLFDGDDELCWRIRSVSQEKLSHALALTSAMRNKYFETPTRRDRSRRSNSLSLKKLIPIAAARMTA